MIEGTSLLVGKCADGIMVGIRYDIVVGSGNQGYIDTSKSC